MEAVNGWPLKKVARMSLGVMGSAAKAALAKRSVQVKANGIAVIQNLQAQRGRKKARPSGIGPVRGMAASTLETDMMHRSEI